VLEAFIDVALALVAASASTLAGIWGYRLTVHPIAATDKARRRRYGRAIATCGIVGVLAVGVSAWRGRAVGKLLSEIDERTKTPPTISFNPTINVPSSTQPSPRSNPVVAAPIAPLSDFSNTTLRDMTKSVVPRMIEEFRKWDLDDAHLDGMRAYAKPEERVSIQEQRDRLRADYVISSKQVVGEAIALRLEILRRLGLSPNADDDPLQNVFKLRDGAIYLDNLAKKLSP
jgi:hypothetical protein